MSPAVLRISKSGRRSAPELPIEAVTRTFGIFGQRGTGKTNTAVVLVEEMVRKGGHVVIFDPVGAWWGITHDGDGKGLPGIVLGGEHADVPLEETAGALVAELIVGRHWPVVVVDMKLLRKGAQRRFLADCLEDLYLHNREPLHVVFEEADTALPQSPRGMDPTIGRVLGAAEDIVKYGRGRGLGASLVSQRFATVNANVREQVETLILLRLMGPLDRKAAKGWIEANGDAGDTAKVLGSMASLEQGEGWLYSPGWLGLLERIRMKYRQTFDSSATPEVGQTPATPGKRAPVDLDALRERMAETVERAAAKDPKLLSKRIAELEAEVSRLEGRAPETVRVPDEAAVMALRDTTKQLDEAAGLLGALAGDIVAGLERATAQLAGLGMDADNSPDITIPAAGELTTARVAGSNGAAKRPRDSGVNHDGREAAAAEVGVSKGALRLLDELRGLAPLALTRTQLATILGRGSKSSTLTQQLAELKAAGALEDLGGRFRPVASPVANAPAMSLAQVRERWLSALPDGPRAMLLALIQREEVERDELFRAAGFSPTSSTPVTHLKLLRDNGLAYSSDGLVMLGEALRFR